MQYRMEFAQPVYGLSGRSERRNDMGHPKIKTPPINRGGMGYCIHDPRNKQRCILADPNLCRHDFFSQCIEANPREARQTGRTKEPPPDLPLPEPAPTRPFYDEEEPEDKQEPYQTIPMEMVGIQEPASPTPAASEAKADPEEDEHTPYEAKSQLFEMPMTEQWNRSTVFETLEIATDCLNGLITDETRNAQSIAHLLDEIEAKFFPTTKKLNKPFKQYISEKIRYDYGYCRALIKAWRTPLLREYWDQLGPHRIKLLLRFKRELTPELVSNTCELNTHEAKDFLFPKQEKHPKQKKVDAIIKGLKQITPASLDLPARNRLAQALTDTLNSLQYR
jgi:hypothetical protein